LAIQTLQIALDRNPVKGEIILHSDQGSQYTSRAFTEFCEEKGIRQSMSKAGCPYDNSPMIFFSVNVTKMLDHLRHRDCSVRKNEVDGLS
jgi:transposase InsO family protein